MLRGSGVQGFRLLGFGVCFRSGRKCSPSIRLDVSNAWERERERARERERERERGFGVYIRFRLQSLGLWGV